MINDPKVLGLALLGGIIPSFLWLWFWLREDKNHPEPKGVLAVLFVAGMISVIFVLPIQKFIQVSMLLGPEWDLTLWASAEEVVKYLAVLIVLSNSGYIDEPVDWPIYLITAALGFAALENAMFLVKPIAVGETTVSLLTGQLRFLGSTLLHTVASGILGIALGLSFRLGRFAKKIYFLGGLGLAIALHNVFNFFIIKDNGSEVLKVFAFLWVATIIVLLLFEKVRRIN